MILMIPMTTITNIVLNTYAGSNQVDPKLELIEKLKSGVYLLNFKKVDGSDSSMVITLQDKHIPQVDRNDARTKQSNENTVAVYALDRQGWRSFRVDSVKTLNEVKLGA